MPIKLEFRPLYKTDSYRTGRAAVRDRAGDTCEDCGRLNCSVHIVTAAIAGTDLVEGLRLLIIRCGAAHRNNIPGDDRLENLAWWCRGCHLRQDAPLHAVHGHETRCAVKDPLRPLVEGITEWPEEIAL
jgi:hypothetical protein